jgi:molybdopterin-guanine dinucleotide biosynthesis protein A
MIKGDNSAVILAGGKSSLGRAKALLEFDGQRLITHFVGN